ncbi:MAG: hypothetical protein M3O36_04205 [Myxococcota bacterium]|nr:hypothetical protein [Myxococcota bacterium]
MTDAQGTEGGDATSLDESTSAAETGANDGDAGADDRDPGVDAGDAGADPSDAFHGTPCDVDAADGASSCSGAMSCCGGFCTDTSHDPRNCGSCSNACTSAQFCTGVACEDAVLKNLCANSAATVVFDPYTDDNEAGARMGNALATKCVPAVTVTLGRGDAGTGVDPDSGRPTTGPGNTLVVGGGAYGQPSVAYIDDNGLSAVRLQADGTKTWFQDFKTDAGIVTADNTMLTPHHDYFLLELSVEPVSGSLCFFGIGFLNAGTAAAGYYFENSVMPSLSTFPDAWYVYEWTDTDGDSLPSAGDMFLRRAQGR